MRFLFSVLVAALLLVTPSGGQVTPLYDAMVRPPGVVYDVVRTRHFDLIYQRGSEADARELGAILEETLEGAGRILPLSKRFRMPVVLNRLNDRGNGYVRTFPFRQEIESSALKGRSVSPRHSSWFATVGPHELVHAVHADFKTGPGFGWLVRPFAPDLARSINLWVPSGVAEGAAVFYESALEEGAGRLHHSYFTAPFRAAAGSGRPWSLAEALEVPAYTRPGDRYYVGGSGFFEWLRKVKGPDAFRRTSSFHNRFPFLGYGLSLWVGTGSPPWKLGRAFQRDAVQREQTRIRALGSTTTGRTIAAESGMLHRRPRWLDNESVLVYRTAYDRRRGLYRVDVRTGRAEHVAYQDLADDFFLSVTPDGATALIARNHPDRWTPMRSGTDLYSVDLASGRVDRLSRDRHLMAPTRAPDGGIWAIRTDGSHSAWVRYGPSTGRIQSVFSRPGVRILSVEPDPRGRYAAIVLNDAGSQGLFLAHRGPGGRYDVEPGVLFEDGAVYDASWSPDGRWIVLTADDGGVTNVFAFDPESKGLVRMTNVRYGAMEPAVSPDTRRLVFVELAEDRSNLVEIAFRPEESPRVEPGRLKRWAGFVAPARAAGDRLEVSAPEPYRALGRLAPRMLYPIVYAPFSRLAAPNANLGWGWALALQGSDPLQRWTWWGEGILREGRGWGEVGVSTGASILRPVVRFYDRPGMVTMKGASGPGTRYVRGERGIQAAVGVPVILSSNVYSSTASLGMGLQYEQERLFDADMTEVVRFDPRLTLTPYVSTAIGVQRNLRDLIPNTGLTLGVSSEIDLSAPAGDLRRAAQFGVSTFLPLLSRFNGGLRLGAGLLAQNNPGVLDTDLFTPRGQEDVAIVSDWAVRFGAEVVVPVRFVDNGTLLLPVFLHAVYLYGFGERMLDGGLASRATTSLGGGIGIQLRLLHVLPLDLRFGAARRIERKDWVAVYR